MCSGRWTVLWPCLKTLAKFDLRTRAVKWPGLYTKTHRAEHPFYFLFLILQYLPLSRCLSHAQTHTARSGRRSITQTPQAVNFLPVLMHAANCEMLSKQHECVRWAHKHTQTAKILFFFFFFFLLPLPDKHIMVNVFIRPVTLPRVRVCASARLSACVCVSVCVCLCLTRVSGWHNAAHLTRLPLLWWWEEQFR